MAWWTSLRRILVWFSTRRPQIFVETKSCPQKSGLCKSRVSTESNRKKRHSSVHFSISASSCRNPFRFCATSWCLLDELTRSSREKVMDQTLLQTKRKNDVTCSPCSSFSSWYLSFSACNWAEINLEPLIPAASAPAEDIFWSEVTKLGTHFSLKNSSHPREDSTS